MNPTSRSEKPLISIYGGKKQNKKLRRQIRRLEEKLDRHARASAAYQQGMLDHMGGIRADMGPDVVPAHVNGAGERGLWLSYWSVGWGLIELIEKHVRQSPPQEQP